MPFPLIPLLAIGGGLWALGKGVKDAGEGVSNTVDSTTKLIVIAGVTYLVVKKLS